MSDTLIPQITNPSPQDFTQPQGSINYTGLDALAVTALPQLMRSFNITKPTFEDKDAFNYITKYFQERGVKRVGSLAHEISKITRKIGRSDNTLRETVNYLRTLEQIEDFKLLKKSMER